jgi:hypothetical protein
MKISDHIRSSLDSTDRRELDQAMLFACAAIDGTAKKTYPDIDQVGKRFKKFITDNIDIVELMFGGFNLQDTVFPFPNNRGQVGIKIEDIIYEKFRCSLAHGDELPEGYGITIKVEEGIQQGLIDFGNSSMTLPESVIYALGLPCVLAPVNVDQKVGDNRYHYRDPINHYVIDRWWGKVDCAREIMDFESLVRVKMIF